MVMGKLFKRSGWPGITKSKNRTGNRQKNLHLHGKTLTKMGSIAL
jgi:hypothetical protein